MVVDVVGAVAERMVGLDLGRPVRVAVDGITGVGKTTFAGNLVAAVQGRGRVARHVSMDGFHNPRAIRHRRGRGSPDGYYEDAYDLASMRRHLLDPLGPGGDRRYRSAVIDLAADAPIEDAPSTAGLGDVFVVDGSFLQRPELRDGWDLVIYLHASFEAAEARGTARDADAMGGLDAAVTAFRTRYHAAQRRYIAECSPMASADVVVDAEDVTALCLGSRSAGQC